MKLRLNHDSLRLRLTPAEVMQFSQSGSIAQTTPFGGGHNLNYMLQASPAATAITASFGSSGIIISVPQTIVRTWATGNEVAISAAQPLPNGQTLQILIEKDFYCLDPTINDPAVSLYPNPKSPSHNS